MSHPINTIWEENLQELKDEKLEMLPIKPTDSPLVKKIKYENEVSNFIFDQILKQ